VTCEPPTASSARVISSNEAFEPFTNLYVRKVTGGEFAIVNKHLVKELEAEGLWNRTMLNELIKNNGSIQNIPTISQELKDIYKTVWELSQNR
jgi:ribonucleoside-diphosphate reductase alpha chain